LPTIVTHAYAENAYTLGMTHSGQSGPEGVHHEQDARPGDSTTAHRDGEEALAERVGNGVGQAEISRLEHDRIALPRRGRLEQIAQALDLPLGVLLARSGWAGAEEELTEAVATAPPPSPVVRAEASTGSLQGASPLNDEMTLLVDARVRAHDVARRTETMLRQSRETMSRARQVVNRRGVERRTSA
jgi:transcriptional regulator with XRE-family HTH domain